MIQPEKRESNLPRITRNSKIIEDRLAVLKLIQEVNTKNESINSFRNKKFNIIIQDKLIANKFQANVSYVKYKNFRLNVRSIVGEEVDLGSNKDQFWIWSRRMNPSGVYFADHKDIYKTNLRTPFHPIWLKQILGLDPFTNIDFVAVEHIHQIELMEMTYASQYKPVIRSTLIDKEDKKIVGHRLYENHKLIASSTILDHELRGEAWIPTTILVEWYEEKVSVLFNLISSDVNVEIPDTEFNLPNKTPLIPLVK